jgi:hypothetical protein
MPIDQKAFLQRFGGKGKDKGGPAVGPMPKMPAKPKSPKVMPKPGNSGNTPSANGAAATNSYGGEDSGDANG